MTHSGKEKIHKPCSPRDVLTDEDVYEAMKLIPGYLDISLADFREIYLLAFRHAEKRIRETLRVENVMTSEVIAVESDEPIHRVAGIMAANNITGLPVVNNDNTVAGVVSREDFFSHLGEGRYHSCMALLADCLSKKGCAAVSIRGHGVSRIMTSPAITVTPATLLADVARLMSKRKINRLPVVDDHGLLVGFLSRTDLINSFPFQEIK